MKLLESWINQEINIVIMEQLPKAERYQKARLEGYLSALKKAQAKIQEVLKE